MLMDSRWCRRVAARGGGEDRNPFTHSLLGWTEMVCTFFRVPTMFFKAIVVSLIVVYVYDDCYWGCVGACCTATYVCSFLRLSVGVASCTWLGLED